MVLPALRKHREKCIWRDITGKQLPDTEGEKGTLTN
jgi:hypothetical protein